MRSFSEQVLEPHFGSNRPGDQPVPDGVLDLDLTNRQATPKFVHFFNYYDLINFLVILNSSERRLTLFSFSKNRVMR